MIVFTYLLDSLLLFHFKLSIYRLLQIMICFLPYIGAFIHNRVLSLLVLHWLFLVSQKTFQDGRVLVLSI